MQTDTPPFRRIAVPPLKTGESPVWDARGNALYFVDIQGPTLFRSDMASGDLKSWLLPADIGSFGLCKAGGMIVGLRTGVHLFDPSSQKLTLLCNPEPDSPHTRLNDGKISPDGRFWVGSMDERPERAPIAGLYRIDPDGRCTRMLDKLRVSNGLAWSPDGSKMYHSDTRQQWVQVFDYADGEISGGRQFCILSDADGRPDGAAMDAEGCYWSAGVSAGCLNRIAPDGRVVRKLYLPLAAPTMPCFGGEEMKTLFVTSLTKGDEPGGLIALEVDVPGVAVARFG